MIAGAVLGWILLVAFIAFASGRLRVLGGVLCTPCILLLTYFAFGGNIPRRWQEKGISRVALIAVIFWISFFALMGINWLLPADIE